MSEATREKATKDLAMIEEVTAVILPEPADANAVITLEQADAPSNAPVVISTMTRRKLLEPLRNIIVCRC